MPAGPPRRRRAGRAPCRASRLGALTAREIDVLHLMADGASNAAIGEALVISQATVKSHVRHILRKLGAANRTEAVSLFLATAAPTRRCGAYVAGPWRRCLYALSVIRLEVGRRRASGRRVDRVGRLDRDVVRAAAAVA